MKWLFLSAALLFSISGFAQTQPAVSFQHEVVLPAAALDPSQLDNLIAPIALYPDHVLLCEFPVSVRDCG